MTPDPGEVTVWLTATQEDLGCNHVTLLLGVTAAMRARFLRFDAELLQVSHQDIRAFELDHKRTDLDPVRVLRSWAKRTAELGIEATEEVRTIFNQLTGGTTMAKKKFQTPSEAPTAPAPKRGGLAPEKTALMEAVGNGALAVIERHRAAAEPAAPPATTGAAAPEGNDQMAKTKTTRGGKKTSKKTAPKKAAPAKAKAKVPSAATAKRGSNGLDEAAKITVLSRESGFREGSIRDKAFKKILACKTVGAALAAVPDRWHLKNAAATKKIKLG